VTVRREKKTLYSWEKIEVLFGDAMSRGRREGVYKDM